MKNDECRGFYVKPEPTKYTQGKDWQLEGNRPRVSHDMPEPTTNKPAETGLVVRQPL